MSYLEYQLSADGSTILLTTIANPKGGVYASEDNETGAIVIALPASWAGSMSKLKIDISQLTDNLSFALSCTGEAPDTTWQNCSAQIVGNKSSNNRVRFGYSGAGCRAGEPARPVIVIGDITSTWTSPKVVISNFAEHGRDYDIGHINIDWDIQILNDLTGYIFDVDIPDALLDAKGIINQGDLATTNEADADVLNMTHAPAEAGADKTSNQFAQSLGSIDSTTVNFDGRNDRDNSAITVPVIATDGTAIDHTINTDGSADISFEWSWSGTESDIDGFVVYVRGSTSSASYNFGTTPSEEITFYCRPDRRHFILKGVAANLYWTFGVLAYRIVDPDINSSGAIATAVIQPSASGEDPYQPSTNVAFAGNITGTVNDKSVSSVVYHDGSVIKRTDGTGVDADSLPESTARKWAGESGADKTGEHVAKNLQFNGDFELDADGETNPTYWTRTINRTPKYAQVWTTSPEDYWPPWKPNAHCFYGNCDDASEWVKIESNYYIAVNPDSYYCLSCWIKTNASKSYLGLEWYDKDYTKLSYDYVCLNAYKNTHDWEQKVSAAFKPSDYESTVRYVKILCFPQYEKVGYGMVSRIQLLEAKTPVPWESSYSVDPGADKTGDHSADIDVLQTQNAPAQANADKTGDHAADIDVLQTTNAPAQAGADRTGDHSADVDALLTTNAPVEAGADVTNYEDTRVANAILDSDCLTVAKPIGGAYSSSGNPDTGAIVVHLPQGYTNTMMSFFIDVYTFQYNISFSIFVSGYNYSSTPKWADTTANLLGSTAADNRIRFGNDGSKCCVIIGDTDSDWYYPKVTVHGFRAGHINYSVAQWETGWDVTIESDLTGYTTDIDYSDALIDANNAALANNTRYVNDATTEASHEYDVRGIQRFYQLNSSNFRALEFYDSSANLAGYLEYMYPSLMSFVFEGSELNIIAQKIIWLDTGHLDIPALVAYPYEITDDYTIPDYSGHLVYACNATKAITVTLPDITNSQDNEGLIVIIKDISGNAYNNNITIRPHGSQTIQGIYSHIIGSNYGESTLISGKDTGDKSVWYKLAES